MPELPEVENLKRQLEALLPLPDRIATVRFFRKDLRFPIPKKLKTLLPGCEISAIERRAKYLLFKSVSGWFLSHLGMSGSWRPVKDGEERLLHDHVELKFESGVTLVFNDPRRFGYVDWVEPHGAHVRLDHLGPEPLADEFTGETLFDSLRGRTAAVKTSIMDQRIVVGVGNIYASESLFRARVKPTRAAGRVTRAECMVLASQIKAILREAIDSGGSTIRTYRGADGAAGQFQSRFSVYEREGEACRNCQTGRIRSKVLGSRSTYWCPQCQT